MRAGTMVVLSVSALLAWGCAGSAGDGTESSGPVSDVVASVEVKLQQDEVKFFLHVTNTGEAPLAFTFPSSQRYDFVVRSGSGEEVWRWSGDMAFLQAISEATLAPGETWAFDVAWEPGDRSGQYEVEAVVTAQEHDVRQRASFALP